MFKLLKINHVLSVLNAVYRVDTETLFEFNQFDGDNKAKLIDWLNLNNYDDDQYLVCKYENGVYQETVGVVFFHRDNLEDSFVDCAEWDFRVMGDVAHKTIPRRYLNKALLDGIKKYKLEDKVADLISEEYFKHDL